MGIWVRYMLRRGPRGLGIDVDGNNLVIELLANGQAAADGLARPGDVIEFVDGVALADRRLDLTYSRGVAESTACLVVSEPPALLG